MFTNAVANAMLNDIPATYGDMTVGLSTTTPILDNGAITNVTEPTGGDYARVVLPTSAWAVASNRTKVTNQDIDFGASTADWGFVSHVVVYNQSSGASLFFGQLTQVVNVVAGGKRIRISAGTISLALPAD
jgi:hypothetical protein